MKSAQPPTNGLARGPISKTAWRRQPFTAFHEFFDVSGKREVASIGYTGRDMTDDPLQIEKLVSQGDQALAEAIAQHAPRLQQAIELRIDPRLAGRIDAADVLQEAFLEARKRLARYLAEQRVPLFVWLRGVVLDTLIDFHRRHLGAKMRDAGQEVSLHRSATAQASSVALAACLMGDLTSPSQAAMREETAHQIETALADMDEVDREVLILRHFEQLSNDEVAAIVGVKKAAASRRYMRALTRFRRVLLAIPGFEQ
jgi:RNA polymerase sigma-70 factor, ECF subfamily